MLLARARERGLDPVDMVRAGQAADRPEWVAGGRFLEQYLDVLDSESALDYADLVFRAAGLAGAPGGPARPARALPLGAGRRVPGHRPLPGRAAAGAGRRRPQPRGRRRPRPVDLRLPRGRGARHPRLPRRLPRPARASAPRWSRCRRRDASARACSPRRGGSRRRCPRPARSRPTRSRPSASRSRSRARWVPDAWRSTTTTPPAPRSSTSPTCCAAPTSRTTCRGRRWRCWSAPAAPASPTLRRNLVAAGVPVEVGADDTPLVAESGTQPLLDALSAALHLATDDPQDPQYVDADRAEALLLSPLGGLDAAEIRLMARALHRREKQQVLADGRPAAVQPRAGALRGARPLAARRPAVGPRHRQGATAGRAAASGRRPRRRRARRPRRCCGRCGRAPAGPSSCARRPPPAGRERCAPTATSTRSARCSTRRPRRRSSAATPARRPSWRRWRPSRSPPTASPTGGCAATRSGSSPPTGPRAWSGGWWCSTACRSAPGPTCGGARPCWPPTVSAPTASCPPSRRVPCWPRSGGSSTSPAPAPGSGSS